MNPVSRLGSRIIRVGASRPSVSGRLRSKAVPSRHMSADAAAKEGEEEEDLPEIDQRRLPADYDPADFDPTEHRSPPTPRLFRLVDEVAGLTLVEAAELSSILLRRAGMGEDELPAMRLMKRGSGPPPPASVAGPAAGVGPATEELKQEKTAFDLRLEAYEAASKIKVIKEVRGFTSLGLKEAKELVEKAPVVIKLGLPKDEAQQLAEKMAAAGAKVVLE